MLGDATRHYMIFHSLDSHLRLLGFVRAEVETGFIIFRAGFRSGRQPRISMKKMPDRPVDGWRGEKLLRTP
jgi:hypothetical protein